ncbi:MAG: T9SS type A sorting domain-containing protein [Bacteroidales bacterium]|nr:T9SS type A sorting domain-containing protein [Bacteroidales bacterium]
MVDERDFLESLFVDRKQDLKDGKCVHTVTKVEQIADLQGNLRKHITLDDNVVWIEGIGSTRGLLHSYDSYMVGSYLSSFTENEAVVYQRNFCPCKTSLMETNLESYIPNPVKDKLTLTLPNANNEIKIFDLQGKLWLQQNVGLSAEINVSMLQTGTYVLVVNGESYKFVKE